MTGAELVRRHPRDDGHAAQEGIERMRAGVEGMLALHGAAPIYGWSFCDGYLTLTLMPPPSVGGLGDRVCHTALPAVAWKWQTWLKVAMGVAECRGWTQYSALQELEHRLETAAAAESARLALSTPMVSLRCITVGQIWAWAFFGAGKDVECRQFLPGELGLMGIHCGRSTDVRRFGNAAAFIEGMTDVTVPGYHQCMERAGKIIGTVEIVAVEDAPDSVWYTGDTRYGWVVRRPRLFVAGGYRARGRLGVWKWTPPDGCVKYQKRGARL